MTLSTTTSMTDEVYVRREQRVVDAEEILYPASSHHVLHSHIRFSDNCMEDDRGLHSNILGDTNRSVQQSNKVNTTSPVF